MSYYEDEIYHSGYLDGYYASMELYHADPEMTDEEKEKAKVRRKKRLRNIALGVGGAAALGAGGYAIGRALRKRKKGGHTGPRPAKTSGPTLERVYPYGLDIETPIGWDFKKNKPKYETDDLHEGRYKVHKIRVKSHFWDHDKKQEMYDPELDPDVLKFKEKYKKYNL